MKLAMVGVGKLGLALLQGVTSRAVISAQDIGLLDVNTSRTQQLAQQYGAHLINQSDLAQAERILICVQPRVFPEVAQWLSQYQVGYISTLAGVSLQTLSAQLNSQRVVRSMPNLAATIGKSQTALSCPNEAQQAGDLAFAKQLFGAVGDVYELSEHLFNSFTGMSASGPAYVAVIAEALADGGVNMGLPRALANELAAKLLVASGELMQQRAHPAMLKDEVCSAGGTTIAGIEALETAGVRGALIRTVAAATQRGYELGQAQQQPAQKPNESKQG